MNKLLELFIPTYIIVSLILSILITYTLVKFFNLDNHYGIVCWIAICFGGAIAAVLIYLFTIL